MEGQWGGWVSGVEWGGWAGGLQGRVGRYVAECMVTHQYCMLTSRSRWLVVGWVSVGGGDEWLCASQWLSWQHELGPPGMQGSRLWPDLLELRWALLLCTSGPMCSTLVAGTCGWECPPSWCTR